jgi:Gpi18-like mannosyltransferase
MSDLNYVDDIEEMSEEARHLARHGVVILKCYKAMSCMHLKVTTGLTFDDCCSLVAWYIRERFHGHVTQVNIGDFIRKGDLLFSFVGHE